MTLIKILIVYTVLIQGLTNIYGQVYQDTVYSSPDLDGRIYYVYYFQAGDYYISTIDVKGIVGDSYTWWPDESYIGRAYVSFDISSVLLSVGQFQLESVQFNIYQRSSIGNNNDDLFPIFFDKPTYLVPCIMDHIIYGDTLDTTDFTAGDINDLNTLTSNIGSISTTPDIGWRSLDITEYVLDDLSSGRDKSQFRIRFLIPHDNDFMHDALIFLLGNHSISKPYIILNYVESTSINNDPLKNLPANFILHQNYPNPFNPLTNISYQINQSTFVDISIYDINGNLVESLVRDSKNPGNFSVIWDANRFNSGIYFYKITAGEFSDTKKCLLVK